MRTGDSISARSVRATYVRVKKHRGGMVSRDTQGFTVNPWVGVSHKLVNPWVGVSHKQVVT